MRSEMRCLVLLLLGLIVQQHATADLTCTDSGTVTTSLGVCTTTQLDNGQITTDGSGNVHLLSTNQPVDFTPGGSLVSEGGASFAGNVLMGGILGVAGNIYTEGTVDVNQTVSAQGYQMQFGHGSGSTVTTLMFAQFTIPSASIRAMTGSIATDYTLMTAPDGQYFRIISTQAYLDYNSTPYATGSAFGLFYISSDLTTRTMATPAGAFPNAWITGNTERYALGTGISNYWIGRNKLQNSRLTFGPSGITTVTNGNSDVIVDVTYLLVESPY